MKLGVHMANFTFPEGPGALAQTIADTARAAEGGGCEQFTVMDHWFQMESLATAQDPMLEGYTTLGYVAALTERIRLGLLVTGVTYRHPGLLAKTVTTLDVLSGGRAQLGIGAGWYEREHRGLGVPFPPIAERFERLEETLQICLQMWSDDDGPYTGRHFSLEETICVPQPLSRPPIMIGGSGEKKTLKLVARYADACNLFASSVSVVEHKLDVLRRHCETEGRDYEEITKTIITGTDALHGGFAEEMARYAALGVELVCVSPPGDHPAAWVEQVCGAVLPELEAL